ncbi:MAG: hypothetical protein WB676_28845 [Bryobacteraceae bacterium]
MQNLQRESIVQALADALRSRGSWTGETHVQKTMYFLQELLGVPTGFEFILYKHGPYSFDLGDALSSMMADGFLEWQPREPYGPSIIPGPASERLKKLFPKTREKYKPQINFVADQLAKKDVRELERIATALLVSKKEKAGVRERANQIHQLKPHVSLPDAISAVEELDRISEEVKSAQLFV